MIPINGIYGGWCGCYMHNDAIVYETEEYNLGRWEDREWKNTIYDQYGIIMTCAATSMSKTRIRSMMAERRGKKAQRYMG